MQKTRLGISAGLLGAAIYFTGLFSGFLVAVLLTGYVLLFEENEWLKKAAVKAVALMIFFSLITVALNLVPNAINFISNVLAIFGGSFSVAFLSRIINAVVSGVDIIEKVLFIGLGIKALKQETIAVSPVDRLIDKYIG